MADLAGEQATVVREVTVFTASAFAFACSGSALAGFNLELLEGLAFTFSSTEFEEVELDGTGDFVEEGFDCELLDWELLPEAGFLSGALD
ncbi:MAG: hypothetical protein ACKOPU_06410 [Candidatus Planktophila sp.]